MSQPFQFKHFTIEQDLCAMKVGTDGVLLGAWTKLKTGNVLDIGSGTGLITLMLAQRIANAYIDAIDINKEAYLQTLANVNSSKWKDNINVFFTSLQQFETSKKYDLIVTNPPYFINSTQPLQQEKTIARHTKELSFTDLIHHVNQHLKKDGVFSIILPIRESTLFIEEAKGKELYLTRKCLVKPNPHKNVKRILMEFSLQKVFCKEEEITIETEKRHHYTKEYINLTQDFYLNF